ncbi:MAG TPA: Smr/MutS family protein, partial [Candidatus Ozemobacteraceae bacterium]|nr:Smr/MutS family protein [Candidatus Ozemobacteraceae bacterium]
MTPAPSAASDDPVEVPINGELDLHTFRPEEVGELVPDYIEACLERGIYSLRIIHGKGKGHLRRSVQAILSRSPHVESFSLADESAGSWG